ncbi:MAG: toll/interleukin-1 receptor domain-containing protein [Chromatiaceae bacterium]|nr:toll/interleukin-1 receptor domain-containing protein [Chromatiaceae bacterium]
MSDFDVFLSHNSKDKTAVRELARRLEGRKIRAWLDEEQLIPGRNWPPLLERGITQSNTGAVLVGQDGLGPWEDEEMQTLLRHEFANGKPVIPVLLPRAPKEPKLPPFLDNRTWVDLRNGFTDQGMDKLIWGITGTPATATPAVGEGRVPGTTPRPSGRRPGELPLILLLG